MIEALCRSVEQPDKVAQALQLKAEQVAAAVGRGNDADDIKKAAASIYTELRRLLLLTSAGSDWNAFARDTLAPLLRPGMATYSQLQSDIFGD